MDYNTQTPSSTLTTAVNGDLIYVVANKTSGGAGPLTAGAGFTKRADVLSSFGLVDEDQAQTTFGTINGYFTATSVSQYTAITAGYKAVPGIGQTLMSNTGSVTNSIGRVKYRLSAGSAQPAGTYTTVITYTIYATY